MNVNNYLKQALVVIASGSAGFYLGGRWVGQKAHVPNPLTERPDWIAEVQEVLLIVMVLFAICVGGWLYLDYMEVKE